MYPWLIGGTTAIGGNSSAPWFFGAAANEGTGNDQMNGGADNDTIDPPNNLVADAVVNFAVDAAPTVTTTTPANGDGNVATNATITVNFSENVNATAGAFALDCGAGAIARLQIACRGAQIAEVNNAIFYPDTGSGGCCHLIKMS